MKAILTAIILALPALPAIAQTGPVGDSFDIERRPFGSGTPAVGVTEGTEEARHVVDGLYHVPNYLPGYPTAAVIWPREIPVDCVTDGTSKPTCSGYEVIPAIGRGEYIFVRPVTRVVPKPQPVVEPKPAEPKPVERKPLPVARKKPLE